MKNIFIIAEKELRDNVTDNKFLMGFIFLMFLISATSLNASKKYNEEIQNLGFDDMREKTFAQVTLLLSQTNSISTFGAILAVCVSYNIFSKEQGGTLKVLLSYPIYRDTIIYAKILSGFISVCIVVIFSSLIGYGIIILLTGLTINTDMILRLIGVTISSIIFLSSILGISTLLSSCFADKTTALITSLLIISLLGSHQMTQFISITGNAIYGTNVEYKKQGEKILIVHTPTDGNSNFQRIMNQIDLNVCYGNICLNLLMPFNYIKLNNEWTAVDSTMWDMVIEATDLILTQIITMVLSIFTSYLMFRKKDLT